MKKILNSLFLTLPLAGAIVLSSFNNHNRTNNTTVNYTNSELNNYSLGNSNSNFNSVNALQETINNNLNALLENVDVSNNNGLLTYGEILNEAPERYSKINRFNGSLNIDKKLIVDTNIINNKNFDISGDSIDKKISKLSNINLKTSYFDNYSFSEVSTNLNDFVSPVNITKSNEISNTIFSGSNVNYNLKTNKIENQQRMKEIHREYENNIYKEDQTVNDNLYFWYGNGEGFSRWNHNKKIWQIFSSGTLKNKLNKIIDQFGNYKDGGISSISMNGEFGRVEFNVSVLKNTKISKLEFGVDSWIEQKTYWVPQYPSRNPRPVTKYFHMKKVTSIRVTYNNGQTQYFDFLKNSDKNLFNSEATKNGELFSFRDGMSYNGSSINVNYRFTNNIIKKDSKSIYLNEDRVFLEGGTSKNVNLNTFVVTNFKLDKILNFDLSDDNKYSNNGAVWTKPPMLKFKFNDEILSPAYELFSLKKLNVEIDKLLFNPTTDKKIKDSLLNLSQSIFKRTKLFSEYKKQFDDLLNKGQLIPIDTSLTSNEIYKNFEDTSKWNITIPTNVDEWDIYWNVISTYLGSNDIYLEYSTPKNNQLHKAKIWDKNSLTLNEIEMPQVSYTNEQQVIFSNIYATSNNLFSNIVYNVSSFSLDSKYSNFTKNEQSETILYKYLYRKGALNYKNFDISSRNNDNRSIEVPLDKYVSEVVKLNNDFVDITGGEVLRALNKVITTDGKKEVFNEATSIHNSTNILSFSNWIEGLDYFGIPHNKDGFLYYDDDPFRYPTFVRNDSDGIFYTIARINKWNLIGDSASETHGEFSQEFVDKLRNNKDIFELKVPLEQNDQGYFLIKCKSNVTTSRISSTKDLESWNPNFNVGNKIIEDIRNPLNIFNTTENATIIKKFLSDVNNYNSETIINDFTDENNNEFQKIQTLYSLDTNKTFNLKLNYFGGTFTQDYKQYETGDNNDGYYGRDGNIPTLEYDFLKKVFKSDWNKSNYDTGEGRIVSRNEIHSDTPPQKKYEYILNPKYKIEIKEDYSYFSEYNIKYDAYLTDANGSTFSYEINIVELISMFKNEYENHHNESFKKEYSEEKDNFDKYISEKLNKTSVMQKPNKPVPDTQLSNRKELNTGALVGGVSSGILIIIITLLVFLFWRSNKKRRMLFGDVDVEKKDSKGDK